MDETYFITNKQELDMTQEDKEILIRDLCGRLPYGVKCKYYDCCEGDYYEGTICGIEPKEYIQINGVCIYIEEVKLYLLPMSSMTEEQKNEYQYITERWMNDSSYSISDSIDWLNSHHFDYRGLITMGLALDATGKNIY